MGFEGASGVNDGADEYVIGFDAEVDVVGLEAVAPEPLPITLDSRSKLWGFGEPLKRPNYV